MSYNNSRGFTKGQPSSKPNIDPASRYGSRTSNSLRTSNPHLFNGKSITGPDSTLNGYLNVQNSSSMASTSSKLLGSDGSNSSARVEESHYLPNSTDSSSRDINHGVDGHHSNTNNRLEVAHRPDTDRGVRKMYSDLLNPNVDHSQKSRLVSPPSRSQKLTSSSNYNDPNNSLNRSFVHNSRQLTFLGPIKGSERVPGPSILDPISHSSIMSSPPATSSFLLGDRNYNSDLHQHLSPPPYGLLRGESRKAKTPTFNSMRQSTSPSNEMSKIHVKTRVNDVAEQLSLVTSVSRSLFPDSSKNFQSCEINDVATTQHALPIHSPSKDVPTYKRGPSLSERRGFVSVHLSPISIEFPREKGAKVKRQKGLPLADRDSSITTTSGTGSAKKKLFPSSSARISSVVSSDHLSNLRPLSLLNDFSHPGPSQYKKYSDRLPKSTPASVGAVSIDVSNMGFSRISHDIRTDTVGASIGLQNKSTSFSNDPSFPGIGGPNLISPATDAVGLVERASKIAQDVIDEGLVQAVASVPFSAAAPAPAASSPASVASESATTPAIKSDSDSDDGLLFVPGARSARGISDSSEPEETVGSRGLLLGMVSSHLDSSEDETTGITFIRGGEASPASPVREIYRNVEIDSDHSSRPPRNQGLMLSIAGHNDEDSAEDVADESERGITFIRRAASPIDDSESKYREADTTEFHDFEGLPRPVEGDIRLDSLAREEEEASRRRRRRRARARSRQRMRGISLPSGASLRESEDESDPDGDGLGDSSDWSHDAEIDEEAYQRALLAAQEEAQKVLEAAGFSRSSASLISSTSTSTLKSEGSGTNAVVNIAPTPTNILGNEALLSASLSSTSNNLLTPSSISPSNYAKEKEELSQHSALMMPLSVYAGRKVHLRNRADESLSISTSKKSTSTPISATPSNQSLSAGSGSNTNISGTTASNPTPSTNSRVRSSGSQRSSRSSSSAGGSNELGSLAAAAAAAVSSFDGETTRIRRGGIRFVMGSEPKVDVSTEEVPSSGANPAPRAVKSSMKGGRARHSHGLSFSLPSGVDPNIPASAEQIEGGDFGFWSGIRSSEAAPVVQSPLPGYDGEWKSRSLKWEQEDLWFDKNPEDIDFSGDMGDLDGAVAPRRVVGPDGNLIFYDSDSEEEMARDNSSNNMGGADIDASDDCSSFSHSNSGSDSGSHSGTESGSEMETDLTDEKARTSESWHVSLSGTLRLGDSLAINEMGIKSWGSRVVPASTRHSHHSSRVSSKAEGFRASESGNRRHSSKSLLDKSELVAPPLGNEHRLDAGHKSAAAAVKPQHIKNELLMLDALGKGASGLVQRALHLPSLRLVAVKHVRIYDPQVRLSLIRELRMLFNNQNVLNSIRIPISSNVYRSSSNLGLPDTSSLLSTHGSAATIEQHPLTAPTTTGDSLETLGLRESSTRLELPDEFQTVPLENNSSGSPDFATSNSTTSTLLAPLGVQEGSIPLGSPLNVSSGAAVAVSSENTRASSDSLLSAAVSKSGDAEDVFDSEVDGGFNDERFDASQAIWSMDIFDDVSNQVQDSTGKLVPAANAMKANEFQQLMGTAVARPYVVTLHDAFASPAAGTVSIIEEYCGGGSWQEIIDNGGLRDERALARLVDHALRGLAHLHLHQQLHRDIKPANLLLTTGGSATLVADFGVARPLARAEQARTFIGTMIYMAPERLDSGAGYSFPSDIWSLGLSVLALVLGRYPFRDQTFWALVRAVKEEPVPLQELDEAYKSEHEKLAALGVEQNVPSAPSTLFLDFLSKMLEKDPHLRPSAEQLLRHPFLMQHRYFSGPRYGKEAGAAMNAEGADPMRRNLGLTLTYSEPLASVGSTASSSFGSLEEMTNALITHGQIGVSLSNAVGISADRFRRFSQLSEPRRLLAMEVLNTLADGIVKTKWPLFLEYFRKQGGSGTRARARFKALAVLAAFPLRARRTFSFVQDEAVSAAVDMDSNNEVLSNGNDENKDTEASPFARAADSNTSGFKSSESEAQVEPPSHAPLKPILSREISNNGSSEIIGTSVPSFRELSLEISDIIVLAVQLGIPAPIVLSTLNDKIMEKCSDLRRLRSAELK